MSDDTRLIKLDSNIMAEIQSFNGKLSFLEHEQLPRAMSTALNQTMIRTKAYIKGRMPEVFDRPTPWTLNSMYIWKATEKSLTAELRFKRSGLQSAGTEQSYLTPEVDGGARPDKPSEKLLYDKGILKSNERLVPSHAITLNEYGNVPTSLYVKILAALQAFKPDSTMGKRKGIQKLQSKTNSPYFAGVPQHHESKGANFWAIWERRGDKLIPLYVKIQSTHYPKRFPFKEWSEQASTTYLAEDWPRVWQACLEAAGLR